MGDSYLCALCYEYWHGWPKEFDELGREFCSKECMAIFKRREANAPGVEFTPPADLSGLDETEEADRG